MPEEGEYSHADLIGCTRDVDRRPSRSAWFEGVEDYGGPPLLQVEAADGREILVPFARSICREIDVAAKMIRAELPEGLTGAVSDDVSRADDFPGVFPGAVRARRHPAGAGSRADRDSRARSAASGRRTGIGPWTTGRSAAAKACC